MNAFEWFKTALRKYAVDFGRSQRSEFWYFVLFNFLIVIGLLIVDWFIGTYDSQRGFGWLSGLFSLATFVPWLAVGVRRLHDTDRTGFWLLIGLIPIIGTIVLIIFFVQDSRPGDNVYGPNPKGEAAPAA